MIKEGDEVTYEGKQYLYILNNLPFERASCEYCALDKIGCCGIECADDENDFILKELE